MAAIWPIVRVLRMSMDDCNRSIETVQYSDACDAYSSVAAAVCIAISRREQADCQFESVVFWHATTLSPKKVVSEARAPGPGACASLSIERQFIPRLRIAQLLVA